MKLINNSSDLQNIQHIEYRTSKHTHTHTAHSGGHVVMCARLKHYLQHARVSQRYMLG